MYIRELFEAKKDVKDPRQQRASGQIQDTGDEY